MEPTPEELLRHAARPTIEAIGEVTKRAPARLRKVLDHVAESFFNPGLSVADLKDAAGASNDWLWVTFRAVVGLPPWQFVRQCRLETAAWMLRETRIFVADVAVLVGYEHEASFSRRFREWCGLSPKKYRAQARKLAARVGPAPEEIFTWWFWICWRRSELSAELAGKAIEYLEKVRAASSSSR